jgi:hypothetical protein
VLQLLRSLVESYEAFRMPKSFIADCVVMTHAVLRQMEMYGGSGNLVLRKKKGGKKPKAKKPKAGEGADGADGADGGGEGADGADGGGGGGGGSEGVVRVVAQSKIGTNCINSRRPSTQGHSELLPDPRLEYDTRRVCVYGVAKPKQRNPNCDSAPRVGSSRHVGARGRRRHSSSQCAIAPRGIRETHVGV